VYGQTELTRDLYEARERLGGIVIHQAKDVQPRDVNTARPYLSYRQGEATVRVECDYIVATATV
jgi:p-hydroxybenzoate 3-monooxygenase